MTGSPSFAVGCEDHVINTGVNKVEVDVKLLLIVDQQYVYVILFPGRSDSNNDGFKAVFHVLTGFNIN
jgi:hypothetical protein